MEHQEIKEKLLELAEQAEEVLIEKGKAKATADELRGQTEEQETRVEIVRVIAFNSILEKLPEKTKDFAAKGLRIEYDGKQTSYTEELAILGAMKRETAKAYAIWQKLSSQYESISNKIGILRSILGYDREIARATS